MDFTSEQFQAILKGTRGFHVVQFPGLERVRIAVRVLSEAELITVKVDAQSALREHAAKRRWTDVTSVADVDPTLYDRLAAGHLVWSAFYDADTVESDTPKRFFPTPGDVLMQSTVVITALTSIYEERVAMVTPLTTADEERVREVISALGKGQSAELAFSACERSTLVRFATSMARLLSASPTSR